MKLKLHISRKTNLEAPVIVDRIMSTLKENHYIAKIATNDKVTFRDNTWQALLNFDKVRRLDGGEFRIIISNNTTFVSFDYYRTILFQLLIFVAVIVFLLFQGINLLILLATLFYLVALGIQALALTMIASNLLEDALG